MMWVIFSRSGFRTRFLDMMDSGALIKSKILPLVPKVGLDT